MAIRNALISVTDKRGLMPLVKALSQHGVRIFATDGTARFLESKGIASRTIQSLTRFPQILGGRVKTLHPAVFAGLLARAEDGDTLTKLKFPRFDFLICNFYDFSGARGMDEREMAEHIDIGGVSLVRAAAKNVQCVLPLVAPMQYGEFMRRLATGRLDDTEYRRRLAATAWGVVSQYDLEIFSACLSRLNGGAPRWNVQISEEAMPLRYGENPHQTASFYLPIQVSTLPFEVLQGKQLSYCNLLDVHAAIGLGKDAPRAPFCAILKHTNPCGAAIGKTVADAFRRAFNGDPQSAFGGIVVLNRPVDRATAREITERFFEVIIAPNYDTQARKILECKKSLRLLRMRLPARGESSSAVEFRSALGGFLVQSRDDGFVPPSRWRHKSGSRTSRAVMTDLDLAQRLVKHVKSNAIVLVRNGQAIGIGAGQQSRVDSVRIAIDKARRYEHTVQGSACASDAFFPFPDSIEFLARSGVTAIAEPGGSVRDGDVIAAAKKSRVSLYFTGRRHFRH